MASQDRCFSLFTHNFETNTLYEIISTLLFPHAGKGKKNKSSSFAFTTECNKTSGEGFHLKNGNSFQMSKYFLIIKIEVIIL